MSGRVRGYRAVIHSLDEEGSVHVAGGGASGFRMEIRLDRETFDALGHPGTLTVEVESTAAQS